MQLRNLAPTTQQSYLHYTVEFSKFYNCSPEKLDLEAIRQYPLHLLHEKKLSPQSINTFLSSVQFLYLYFHVVFTLPEQIAEFAFYNQDVMYGILFRAASETLLTIGADPKHLGAQLGFFAILHTWGQNLLYHPHLHVVVPGGGLSPDYERFVPCRQRRFFLPVKVLSSLFRRLFLEALEDAFYQERLQFPGSVEQLRDAGLFHNYLYATEKRDWVVYAKPPSAVRGKCSAISAATHIGWPSRINAYSNLTTAKSHSSGKTTANATKKNNRKP